MIKIRITAKQLGRMTPDQLVTKVALEAAGADLNKAIEHRVTGPSLDANGRRLPPKRVKQYRPNRGEWHRKKGSQKREGAPSANATPANIFNQMRELGGVFRSKSAYEAEKLKGGEPIKATSAFTWGGTKWAVGDVWGYRWPSAAAFHSAQGEDDKPDLGGRGSRIWRAATSKAAVRRNGRALLTLSFRGRRPRGDATQVLSDWGQTTKTGRTRKKSIAEIVAVANSRDRDGMVGHPATTGGQPVGGTARLSKRVPDSQARRWRRLSESEIRRILLPAITKSALDALKRAPTKVVLIEGRGRRK